jgi:hypothetical protein
VQHRFAVLASISKAPNRLRHEPLKLKTTAGPKGWIQRVQRMRVAVAAFRKAIPVTIAEMNPAKSNTEAVAKVAAETSSTSSNFIRDIIVRDLETNKYGGRVQTRFPPEPNGYLHIGHAKAIYLDFGLADEFGGHTNLRFDDTNPEKEETEYVDSIKESIKWLGYHWDGLFYASDYFEQLYQWAVQLIRGGKAYVDDLSAEEIRQHRGTLTEPGKDSPYRDRSVADNLNLFERKQAGEVPDGSRVLRA